MLLKDRVAIITGSAQGIGRATAMAMIREGAKVVLNARTLANLEAAAAKMRAVGGEVVSVQGDIADGAVVRRMIDQTMQAYGRIDVLVNNAGSGRSASGNYVAYEDLSEKDWYYIMEQNLKSTHLCSQAVAPIMIRQNGGSIVNISSVAGHTCEPGPSGEKLLAPIEATYVAAKAAVIGFTRQLAKDLAPYGLRVNCVAPGVILRTIPLGRTGTAEEVAEAVVFLASDRAAYITGVTLDVNGGMFMAP